MSMNRTETIEAPTNVEHIAEKNMVQRHGLIIELANDITHLQIEMDAYMSFKQLQELIGIFTNGTSLS